MKKVFVVLVLALVSSMTYGLQETPSFLQRLPSEKFTDGEANFKKVFNRLRESYIDRSVTEDDLYRAAVAGMLSGLNAEGQDWNELLGPKDRQDLKIMMTGRLTGIGATLHFDETSGRAGVRFLLPDSAAGKAGLKENDLILNVNGKRLKNFPEMIAEIRGPVGEKVRLKVLREDRILDLSIVRGQVMIPGFGSRDLGGGTGYLMVSAFTGDAPEKIAAEIRKLKARDLRRLIVDLRGNSGGGFEEAVKVAGLFLPKNTVVVRTTDRNGKTEIRRTTAEPLLAKIPIVVLTNKETSSGGEILTVALKEGAGALVVGGKTRGKWDAQSVEDLSNGYAIKFTVLKFQSASGKSYQNVGLSPDLEIAGPESADLGRLQNDKDLARVLEKDPVLKTAIEVSRSL